MYSEGRFFICTGNIYNAKYTKIADCTESIKPLYNKYFPKEKNRKTYNFDCHIDIDDRELLSRARASKKGSIFNMLYCGCWDCLYSSQSEADLALCNMLAYWTACDCERIDRLFRASGLMREKWDEQRGAQTYGARTIATATASCMSVYQPQKMIEV